MRCAVQEEHRNEAALMDLAASAQLRHQLSILGAALQTAQLDPSQFGLAPAVRFTPDAAGGRSLSCMLCCSLSQLCLYMLKCCSLCRDILWRNS